MCQLRWAVKHGTTIAMTDGPISPTAIDKSMLSKSVTTFQQKSPLTFLTKFTLGLYFKPRIYPMFFGGCYLIRQTVSININPQRM